MGRGAGDRRTLGTVPMGGRATAAHRPCWALRPRRAPAWNLHPWHVWPPALEARRLLGAGSHVTRTRRVPGQKRAGSKAADKASEAFPGAPRISISKFRVPELPVCLFPGNVAEKEAGVEST